MKSPQQLLDEVEDEVTANDVRDLERRYDEHPSDPVPVDVQEQADHPDVVAEVRTDRIRQGLHNAAQVLELPPPEPMVGDYLDRGMVASLVADYGAGKTFAALNMACSVATGRPWFGSPIHRQGVVAFLSLEGAYTLGPRLAGWLEANDLQADDLADRLLVWPSNLDLRDGADVAAWATWAEEEQPELIIVDTLSKATPGVDENASADMSTVYAALARLRDRSKASVVVCHHSGHTAKGRGRGFSGFEADIDVVLSIEGKLRDGPVKVSSQKQKARENPPDFWFRLSATPSGHPYAERASGEPEGDDDTKALILATVRRYPGELVKTDLENSESRGHVPGGRNQVRAAVAKLLAEGEIGYQRRKLDGDRQKRDYLVIRGHEVEE